MKDSNNVTSHVSQTEKHAQALPITDEAPSWFRDGVLERVQAGNSLNLAINAMKKSPFFNREWIV